MTRKSRDVLRFAEEREHLFRDTFEQAAVGITHTDLAGRLLRVNQCVCDMLGYSAAELQELSFVDITWSNLSVALKRAAGGLPDYIIAVIEDIHERKQFEGHLVVLRDSQQLQIAEQTQRLQASNVALHTQIKKVLESERMVRRAEHRLRAVANHIPAFVGYWNRELRCEFATRCTGSGSGSIR